MMRARLIAGLVVVWAVLAVPPASARAADADTVRIGILAYRGFEHVMRSWVPTGDYLTRAIPGVRFEIVPLPLAELEAAIAERTIDYVFTNSGQYVVFEEKYGISRLVTLKKPFGNGVSNVFGAVVFTRADHADMRDFKDLRGKTFAAVRRQAFGGFQMAWREFKDQGIDPFREFGEILFLGLPQDNIVFAVRDGIADAGTVRTDVLETMAAEGAIRLEDFRVLNRRQVLGEDVALSTRLYPEWPFAKMPHASPALSEKVAIALLNMEPDGPEMLAAGYSGWTVPLDYKPVHDLFRDLEIGPYARGGIDLEEFMERYWQWLAFAAVVLVLIVLHGLRTEYLVQRRTRELSAVNRELEHQIRERKTAEERARQHETELAHVSRVSVIGEMTSGLAHELRQPLAAIRNFAEGGIRRLEKKNGDLTEIVDALSQISAQAGRAGQIISRVRGYLQKREPKREPVDVNHAVTEAIRFLGPDTDRNGVDVALVLDSVLPPILGDLTEIEQMIINLARNAIEAMADTDGAKRIEIRTVTDGERVRVTVTDTGPGLNGQSLDALWQPFVTTKESGLGLGLAICRSIAESHGGRIWAEAATEGGLRVGFEIPAGGEAADDAA